ncbi:MAG: phycobilisome linker polypeptide [Cyanobacteriota bacterium]|jgi:phycocyanin-associated rod protein|nr:phycobilisome linker polypeptide [Cyanobacteriota bacterium]
MKVSSGIRGTSFASGRQVSFTVTGLSNNSFSRTADLVMNVPYTRMNETMRMVQRMGGRITGVNVSGGDLPGSSTPNRESRKGSEA